MRLALAICALAGLCLLGWAFVAQAEDPVDCESLRQAAAQAESSLNTLQTNYNNACSETPTSDECKLMKTALDMARNSYENAKAQLKDLGCTP
jgi:hypothetical protein